LGLRRLLNCLLAIGTPCLGLGVESAIPALRVAGKGVRSPVLGTRIAEERPARPERLYAAADVLSDLVESLTGAETAARIALSALHGQLVSELMNGDADLLGHGVLNRDLLCELPEHRDELVCRNVHACVAAKRILERIVSNMTLQPGALQVRICREQALRELPLSERILQERIHLPAEGKLLAQPRLCGLLTECAVVGAGLSEQGRIHLRESRGLQSRKLRHQALLGIL
jgi:hypothetical protein